MGRSRLLTAYTRRRVRANPWRTVMVGVLVAGSSGYAAHAAVADSGRFVDGDRLAAAYFGQADVVAGNSITSSIGSFVHGTGFSGTLPHYSGGDPVGSARAELKLGASAPMAAVSSGSLWRVASDGSVARIPAVGADLSQPLVRSLLTLEEGRMARSEREVVAVRSGLASEMAGVKVGERVRLAEPTGPVTVVGAVSSPLLASLDQGGGPGGGTMPSLLVRPEVMAADEAANGSAGTTSRQVAVVAKAPRGWTPPRGIVVNRPSRTSLGEVSASTWGVVGSAGGWSPVSGWAILLWAAVVAGGTVMISGRRSRRELAQLGLAGGDRRDLMRAARAEVTWTVAPALVVGAGAGAALGWWGASDVGERFRAGVGAAGVVQLVAAVVVPLLMARFVATRGREVVLAEGWRTLLHLPGRGRSTTGRPKRPRPAHAVLVALALAVGVVVVAGTATVVSRGQWVGGRSVLAIGASLVVFVALAAAVVFGPTVLATMLGVLARTGRRLPVVRLAGAQLQWNPARTRAALAVLSLGTAVFLFTHIEMRTWPSSTEGSTSDTAAPLPPKGPSTSDVSWVRVAERPHLAEDGTVDAGVAGTTAELIEAGGRGEVALDGVSLCMANAASVLSASVPGGGAGDAGCVPASAVVLAEGQVDRLPAELATPVRAGRPAAWYSAGDTLAVVPEGLVMRVPGAADVPVDAGGSLDEVRAFVRRVRSNELLSAYPGPVFFVAESSADTLGLGRPVSSASFTVTDGPGAARSLAKRLTAAGYMVDSQEADASTGLTVWGFPTPPLTMPGALLAVLVLVGTLAATVQLTRQDSAEETEVIHRQGGSERLLAGIVAVQVALLSATAVIAGSAAVAASVLATVPWGDDRTSWRLLVNGRVVALVAVVVPLVAMGLMAAVSLLERRRLGDILSPAAGQI